MRELRHVPDLRRFFWAGLAYQAGLAVVITLASVYARTGTGLQDGADTIAAAAGGQRVGGGWCLHVWLRAGSHWSAKPTLAITLLMWIATRRHRLRLAYQTGASGWPPIWPDFVWAHRSLADGRWSASWPTRSCEFYGLWGWWCAWPGDRAAAVGTVTWATAGNHRLALLITGGMFVIGLVHCWPASTLAAGARGRTAPRRGSAERGAIAKAARTRRWSYALPSGRIATCHLGGFAETRCFLSATAHALSLSRRCG